MSEQVAKPDVKIGGLSGVFLRLNRAFGLLRDVGRDRSGASAMEFAFLAPILLAIYISSFEITTGYSVAQKTLKAAGTIADIVTRQETVNIVASLIQSPPVAVPAERSHRPAWKMTGIGADCASTPQMYFQLLPSL